MDRGACGLWSTGSQSDMTAIEHTATQEDNSGSKLERGCIHTHEGNKILLVNWYFPS